MIVDVDLLTADYFYVLFFWMHNHRYEHIRAYELNSDSHSPATRRTWSTLRISEVLNVSVFDSGWSNDTTETLIEYHSEENILIVRRILIQNASRMGVLRNNMWHITPSTLQMGDNKQELFCDT